MEMLQVVLHEELQINVAARRFPDVPGRAHIGMPHDVRQVPVVGQPKIHEVAPLSARVVLSANPLALTVRREHEAVFVL